MAHSVKLRILKAANNNKNPKYGSNCTERVWSKRTELLCNAFNEYVVSECSISTILLAIISILVL